MEVIRNFPTKPLFRKHPLEDQYRIQLKQDAQYMDQPIKIIFVIFIVSETIRAIVGETLFEGPTRWREIIPRIAYLMLISVPTFGGHLILSNSTNPSYVALRKFVVGIGVILYCGLTMYITVWRVNDFAVGYRDMRDRFDFMSFGLIMVSNVIISDVIFNEWRYKAIIPVCEMASVIHAIIKFQPLNCAALLSYMFTLVFYIVAAFWAKDRLAWGIFLNRRNLTEWNQIHQEIFKNIPENIAVYDFNRTILFENEHFTQLRKDIKDQDILDAIVNLKKRNDLRSTPFFTQNRNTNSTSENRHRHSQSNRETCFDNNTFVDLAHLLKTVQRLYRENIIVNKHLLTFDGKYYNHSTKETLSIEVKLVVFEDAQGGSKKLLLILRDTTQRDLISVLESNNKFKDNVIDSVSHELRTPLNGLRTMLDLCKEDQEVPEKVKTNYITLACTSATMLGHIIDDILDYSLLLKNKLSMKLQKVNILYLLEDCYSLIKNRYEQPSITFSLEVDEKIPRQFCTDPERLTRIVANLLSNAFKFTNKGAIILKAKMEGKYLRLIVRDTGIGMSEETMHRLANISVQSLRGEKVSSTSTGVGLGIMFSQFTSYMLGPKNMSGLCFTSELHKGSLFTFLLENKELAFADTANSAYTKIPPLKILPPRSFANEEAIRGNSSRTLERSGPSRLFSSQTLLFMMNKDLDETIFPEDKRVSIPEMTYFPSKSSRRGACKAQSSWPEILLVDDEPINVFALEILFKQFNKTVDKAYGGEEAVQIIQRRKIEMASLCPRVYKLIFMDLNMPEVDGFETTRRIKEKVKKNEIEDVVIVACTAYPENEYKLKCVKAGMDEFVNKPVTKAKIGEILTKYNCL